MSHRGSDDRDHAVSNVLLWLWVSFCLIVVLAIGAFVGWAIYTVVKR